MKICIANYSNLLFTCTVQFRIFVKYVCAIGKRWRSITVLVLLQYPKIPIKIESFRNPSFESSNSSVFIIYSRFGLLMSDTLRGTWNGVQSTTTIRTAMQLQIIYILHNNYNLVICVGIQRKSKIESFTFNSKCSNERNSNLFPIANTPVSS